LPQRTSAGASSGDVLLFIDVDDLPINDNWMLPRRNYADPNCMGVCGRQCPNDEPRLRRKNPKRFTTRLLQ
jgi:hypothetical protein